MNLKLWGHRSSAETDIPETQAVKPAEIKKSDSTDELAEFALNNLSGVLKDYGRQAFDTDIHDAAEITRQCDGWAMHLQYNAPRPETESSSLSNTDGKRDWGGMRMFFARQRSHEHNYVTRTITDLNQVLWTFVRGLKSSLIRDTESDRLMRDELVRLEETANTGTTEQLKKEALSVVIRLSRIIVERQQEQQQQTQALYKQIQDLGVQLEEAREQGQRDGLTSLYNRTALDNEIARAGDMLRIFNQPACLLLVDVDHFKDINDTYGHAVGDETLRKLADCMTMAFPRKTDFISRFGGDEFAVIMPDATLDDGRKVGERLLRGVRELSMNADNKIFGITVSIGLTEISTQETAQAWIQRTDRALYAAKNGGRDRVSEGRISMMSGGLAFNLETETIPENTHLRSA